jgi:hypothetical protein
VKDSDCEQTIQTMGWADLRDMWDKIQKGNVTGWDSGKAFEYLIPRAFQLDGARIKWPYRISLHEEINRTDRRRSGSSRAALSAREQGLE